eukprot:676080-Amorphochlora_amoeboformis.AAC.1
MQTVTQTGSGSGTYAHFSGSATHASCHDNTLWTLACSSPHELEFPGQYDSRPTCALGATRLRGVMSYAACAHTTSAHGIVELINQASDIIRAVGNSII